MNSVNRSNVCLIGLPRCGSQYISEIIENNFNNILNLHEPFTPNHYSVNIKLNSKSEIVKNYQNTLDVEVKNQIKYIGNIILHYKGKKNLLLKLFLTDQYTIPQYEEILNILSVCNFKFLVIKRLSREEQILSFCISKETNTWNNYGTENNSKISITNLGSVDWITKQVLEFEDKLVRLNLNNSPVIRYEKTIEDLENYFNIPMTNPTKIKKMSSISKKEKLINYQELLNLINLKLEKK